MNANGRHRKLTVLLAVILAMTMFSCKHSSSNKDWWWLLLLKGLYFNGTITGTVLYEYNNQPIEGASVKVDVRGITYDATTGSDGTFTLDVKKVKKGEGYNVNFTKTQYDDTTRAAVFTSKGLPVNLGTVYMTDATAGQVERSISGQVLDNYSSIGLEGASVSIQNSHYDTIVGVTDADGNFHLSGYYFMTGSSYVVTISKEYYITLSSVTVSITGPANTITGDPVRLYREYGEIVGNVEDDDTGNPLENAQVSTVDGKGNSVTALTDGSGNFRLGGVDFYVGSTYTVAVSKANYVSGSASAAISSTGDNVITGGALHLMISASVSGIVKVPAGDPIPGAAVQAEDAAHAVIASGTTTSDGSYSLSGTGFRKGVSYTLNFSHAVYESTSASTPLIIEGVNSVGAVTMDPKDFEGYTLAGVVADDWDTTKKLTASVSIIDEDNVTRTATADATGAFSITGNFLGGTGYTMNVSCTGYTGDSLPDRRQVTVQVSGSSPQSLGQITLFPIGIRAYVAGQKREFSYHVRQTQEKFLTGNGFTVSARNGTALDSASTFYLHTDDPVQPSAPDDAHTTSLAINGASSSGDLSAGILADLRTALIGMTSSAMYHFHVTDPGEFTVQTTGATDTYLILYDENGSVIEEDDDDGADANAMITVTLPEGWYFARVQGYDDSIFGFYEIGLTGPQQSSGMTGLWTTGEIIISWYDCANSLMYIAGAGESGSSGSITVSMMNGVGKIARGSFSGSLRAITQAGGTVPVAGGYFNVIRSE